MAAGNACVVKPAEDASLSILRLAELFGRKVVELHPPVCRLLDLAHPDFALDDVADLGRGLGEQVRDLAADH